VLFRSHRVLRDEDICFDILKEASLVLHGE